MAQVNHAKREINAKIVYYGPERAGKATSLRYVHDRIKPSLRGDLKSVPVSGSTMLFFDFSPFEQASFGEYRIRLHIYTLQGRVSNPAAWKMALKGLDGLVFVMDNSAEELPNARQSLSRLREILGGYGVGLNDIPVVLQLNKADHTGRLAVEAIAGEIGLNDWPVFQTAARSGSGVLEALASLSRLVMERIGERVDLPLETVPAEAAIAGPSAAAPSASSPEIPQGGEFREACGAAGASAATIGPDNPDEVDVRVRVAETGLSISDGMVRIPLELATSGGVQRLMVTVTVAAC